MIAALAGLALAAGTVAAEETAWNNTLERISSGVVSIRVDSTRAFDTEWNSSSQATGFVVADKAKKLFMQVSEGEADQGNGKDENRIK